MMYKEVCTDKDSGAQWTLSRLNRGEGAKMRVNIADSPDGSALYRQVVDKLLAKIDSGSIGIGDALLPEPELAQQYAVSRHTMRSALRILQDLGIVDRRPGARTIVKARGPQRSYLQVIRSPQELPQYPESRRFVQSSQLLRADRRLAIPPCEWCAGTSEGIAGRFRFRCRSIPRAATPIACSFNTV